jgi:hypothetical protein
VVKGSLLHLVSRVVQREVVGKTATATSLDKSEDNTLTCTVAFIPNAFLN